MRTALICKSLLGKAHTVMAEGGIAAALGNVGPKDNWKVHFRDTMRGGKMLNHWRMAQLHAQEAPDRVHELEEWGALFDRTKDGRILQRNFGGHHYPRLAHVGDRTGLEMIRTLQQHGVHLGIDVYMECTVTRLLKDGDRVTGAFGYWRESGKFVVFKAKAVVLATGGIGKCVQDHVELVGVHRRRPRAGATWPAPSSSTWSSCSSTRPAWCGRRACAASWSRRASAAKAARSGTRTASASCSTTSRTSSRARRPTPRPRPTGGTSDKKNNRRTPDLLPRDDVARAIHAEVKAGRGSPARRRLPRHRSRRSAEDIKKKLPAMYHQFKELADVDITKEPMEVGPTAHYMMGGVRVDPDTPATTGCRASSPPASAPAACTASNRLGGNSLSDLLVFGRRAGHSRRGVREGRQGTLTIDARRSRRATQEVLAPFEREDGENPYAIHEDLRSVMQSLVGIMRNEAELKEAADELGRLEERARPRRRAGNRHYNPGWHVALDLRNMLIVSEAMARSALARKESRGGHARDDFPEPDPDFGKVNVVARMAATGSWTVDAGAACRRCPTELEKLLEEDEMTTAVRATREVTMRVCRAATANGGEFQEYEVAARRGHGRPRRDPPHPGHAGARPRGALELQGREVRLVQRRGQRQAAAHVHDAHGHFAAGRADHGHADEDVPADQGPGHRRLVQLRGREEDPAVQAAAARGRRHWRMQQEDIDRVQEFRKCIECFLCQNVCHVLRDHEENKPELRRAALLVRAGRRSTCTRSTPSTAAS